MKQNLPVKVPKSWGYELWYANSEKDNYCGKILFVRKGQKCSLHYHRIKAETFFVYSGKIKLIIKDKDDKIDYLFLYEGESFEIKPLLIHQFEAIEDTFLLEASTFHRDSDSYRCNLTDNHH